LLERRPALKYDATAGLSLGEFTALARRAPWRSMTAYGRSPAWAVHAASRREHSRSHGCGYRPDESALVEVCAQAGVELAKSQLSPAKSSFPAKQINEKACESARTKGAKKAMPLPVQGPITPSSCPAPSRSSINFRRHIHYEPRVPVMSNVPPSTQRPFIDPEAACRTSDRTCALGSIYGYLLGPGVTHFMNRGLRQQWIGAHEVNPGRADSA